MTSFALTLVLVAAVVHATWNLLAKRVRSGAAFVWLFSCVAAALYAPVALWVVVFQKPVIAGPHMVFICGTIALHLLYFILLQRGYQAGDLSLVYPLARGTGPLLATIGAVLFLGERPTAVALFGMLCITGGVLLLAGDPRKLIVEGTGRAVAYALLTAGVIGAYTVWDAYAVGPLGLSPLLLEWCVSIGLATLLAPYGIRNRSAVVAIWRANRWETIGVAVLSPLSYILVLTAMAMSSVSYIAPAREISILIAAVMGTRLLAEGRSRRRLAGAAAMVVGVVALALG